MSLETIPTDVTKAIDDHYNKIIDEFNIEVTKSGFKIIPPSQRKFKNGLKEALLEGINKDLKDSRFSKIRKAIKSIDEDKEEEIIEKPEGKVVKMLPKENKSNPDVAKSKIILGSNIAYVGKRIVQLDEEYKKFVNSLDVIPNDNLTRFFELKRCVGYPYNLVVDPLFMSSALKEYQEIIDGIKKFDYILNKTKSNIIQEGTLLLLKTPFGSLKENYVNRVFHVITNYKATHKITLASQFEGATANRIISTYDTDVLSNFDVLRPIKMIE